MNPKIPLLSLATTLTLSCFPDAGKEEGEDSEQEDDLQQEDCLGEDCEDADIVDTSEPDDTADTDVEDGPLIDGFWSLSSSEEDCHASYYTFCGQFIEFTMLIENEELSSSNIVFSATYENETYIENLTMNGFYYDEESISISLSYIADISFGLDCILSDEELNCSGSRPDYELELQATLTK